MKCKHDNSYLMGTADGILCRGCGQLFKTFDELKADAGDAPTVEAQPVEEPEKKPTPKRGRKRKEES